MELQRTILFVTLAMVLFVLWQEWVEYTAPPLPDVTVESTADQPSVPDPVAVPATPSGDVPSVAGAPNVSNVNVPAAGREVLPGKETVVVTTDLLRAEINTLGGDIRVVELLAHPVSVDHPEQPFRLLNDIGNDVFVAQSGLIGNNGELPNHKTPFTVEGTEFNLGDGAESVTVPMTWTSPEGNTYRKEIVFHRDSYLVDVRFTVQNNGAETFNGFLYGQYLRTQVVDDSGFLFGQLPSYKGGAIFTPENKYEKVGFDDMFDANLARSAPSGWVGMLQHYFVSAWLPGFESTGEAENEPNRVEFYSNVDKSRSDGPRYYLGFKNLQPLTVAPGASGETSATIFIGPKEQDRLEQPAEGLILTVDYGWLTPIASPLFWVLENIHDFVGNWGWSIILLTLLVKLIFFPLSAASYKSMAKMKKLQPRLQTLKERYGDDRQKFQAAMMEIYKEEKINPLGGCLPILIQIPVFIALYWVLLESVELRQADFMWWLNDLSLPDPYYVLPLLMGASMFAQQLLNPQPMDKVQKNIMMALPVVFTVFFLWFPAGLVLYWLVNNVLSIAQQWFITNKIVAQK